MWILVTIATAVVVFAILIFACHPHPPRHHHPYIYQQRFCKCSTLLQSYSIYLYIYTYIYTHLSRPLSLSLSRYVSLFEEAEFEIEDEAPRRRRLLEPSKISQGFLFLDWPSGRV